MKYIASVVICIIAIITMTSCKSVPKEMGVNEYSKEVLRCFDEEDVDGLKSLFCEEIQNTHNLDEDIKNALDIYQGKTISYKIIGGTGGETVENGKIVLKDENIQIGEIKTDTGNEYVIVIYSYVINEEYPNRIGISAIDIFMGYELEADKITVGKVL